MDVKGEGKKRYMSLFGRLGFTKSETMSPFFQFLVFDSSPLKQQQNKLGVAFFGGCLQFRLAYCNFFLGVHDG